MTTLCEYDIKTGFTLEDLKKVQELLKKEFPPPVIDKIIATMNKDIKEKSNGEY